MTWLDTIFVILLVLGAARGLLTGKLVPSLIIFAVWVTGIAIAVNFEDKLGSSIGDYSWAPLVGFFIILGIIQLILYGSGIPAMIARNISWRPPRWLDVMGGMVTGGLIAAIICGIIWRILAEISNYVATETSVGAQNAFVELVEDSALRGSLTAFVDWFAPPVGVVLGAIIAAALVALAAFGRVMRETEEEEAEDEEHRAARRDDGFVRGMYRGSRPGTDSGGREEASEHGSGTSDSGNIGDPDYPR